MTNQPSQSDRDQTKSADDPTHAADSTKSVGHPSEADPVSDVVLAESETLRAPTLPGQRAAAEGITDSPKTIDLRPDPNRAKRDRATLALLPGAKVDDFEIVRLLGRGAFGHVYLARQISLDRQVALKISANRGSEGRTMARLEHQHIVQVFSEKVDPDFNQRLLCMQLVPGIGLDKLVNLLHDAPPGQTAGSADVHSWTGAQLLDFIDRSGSLPTALDPSALHDREALARMDSIEATAWFGGRLAEALDFAHHHGVLHRDIKPANILVNPYGRPMLADFNISSQPIGSEPSGEEMFGGTFAYMAPEHLDAFNPGDDTGHEAVTARSDIYSLGLVLQQMLEGRLCFPLFQRKSEMTDMLQKMARDRRQSAPVCHPGLPGARMTLERTIGRCLEPNPDDRFESGKDLAEQLDGCQRLREAERRLPPIPAVYKPILRHPFLWLVALVVLPQLVASVVNITYNFTQIVGYLSGAQRDEFKRLVVGYNAVVYPVAILAFIVVVWPIWRTWNALSKAERLSEGDVKQARRRALRLPRFIAWLTALGWFPGGFIFPIAMQLTTGLNLSLGLHFVASFCLSGIIALAYSLCGVEFVVLRGLYPALWRDARNFTSVAREELASTEHQLNRIEWLATSIPLLAAISVLSFGNSTFQFLAIGLVILGLIGSHVTSAITRHLSSVIVALTNTKV